MRILGCLGIFFVGFILTGVIVIGLVIFAASDGSTVEQIGTAVTVTQTPTPIPTDYQLPTK